MFQENIVKIEQPKSSQERLSELSQQLSLMESNHEASDILGVDFRGYFLLVAEQYQKMVNNNLTAAETAEKEIITSLTEGGVEQLAAFQQEISKDYFSPSDRRRIETRYFHQIRDKLITGITETIFRKLADVYILKSDNEYAMPDLGQIKEDKYYHLLREISKFINQAHDAILSDSADPELLNEELTMAEKVLSRPGVYLQGKTNTLGGSENVGIRHPSKSALFKDAPSHLRLIDYLPVWLRGLPYFTKRKIFPAPYQHHSL